jgi:hypothetical protein
VRRGRKVADLSRKRVEMLKDEPFVRLAFLFLSFSKKEVIKVKSRAAGGCLSKLIS